MESKQSEIIGVCLGGRLCWYNCHGGGSNLLPFWERGNFTNFVPELIILKKIIILLRAKEHGNFAFSMRLPHCNQNFCSQNGCNMSRVYIHIFIVFAVFVKAFPQTHTLDSDSVLFLENRSCLGLVSAILSNWKLIILKALDQN